MPKAEAARLLPVLWVCGPPCVGKSTAAWGLYRRLSMEGLVVGYVDIDQLGMCGGRGPVDPDVVKARNVGQVLENFAAAGADVAIISGVTPPDGVGRYVDSCAGSTVTFARLRLDPLTCWRRATENAGATRRRWRLRSVRPRHWR